MLEQANNKDQITEDLSKALAEVARLKARLDAKDRAESRGAIKIEFLKDAALRALEYIATPNPYADPQRQREKVLAHLDDALSFNGCQGLKFEIVSDKN